MKPLIPIQEPHQPDTFSSTVWSHELINAIQDSCVLKVFWSQTLSTITDD